MSVPAGIGLAVRPKLLGRSGQLEELHNRGPSGVILPAGERPFEKAPSAPNIAATTKQVHPAET
jgi:hypothetical protein